MVYLGMKRGREGEYDSIVSIADWLMLLSHTPGFDSDKSDSPSGSPSRVFECKTCNRQFSSFQALGGHRASHKKQRLVETESTQFSPPKPKTHECAICGLEFTVGQALGGHMRRHRVAASDMNESNQLTRYPLPLDKEDKSGEFLCLDLNLTPKENGMDFQLEKVTPKVICFL